MTMKEYRVWFRKARFLGTKTASVRVTGGVSAALNLATTKMTAYLARGYELAWVEGFGSDGLAVAAA